MLPLALLLLLAVGVVEDLAAVAASGGSFTTLLCPLRHSPLTISTGAPFVLAAPPLLALLLPLLLV